MAADPALSAGLPAQKNKNKNHTQKNTSNLLPQIRCGHTCVNLIAFLWAHRCNTGLSCVLLFAFSPDGTEGGGVAQGRKGGLEYKN